MLLQPSLIRLVHTPHMLACERGLQQHTLTALAEMDPEGRSSPLYFQVSSSACCCRSCRGFGYVSLLTNSGANCDRLCVSKVATPTSS